jgi:hypothetical protein
MNETIALDLNPYCSRAVLLDSAGSVMSHLDTKSSANVQRWLNTTLDQYPTARVVASPLDDCPDEVESELRSRGKRIELLRPTLCRALYHAARPWNLRRKLHRACLLAYLERFGAQPYNLPSMLREFEHERAKEILET